MADLTLAAMLVMLFVLQTAWCLYYSTRYDWRSTPLGPVWLAKGSALAILWALLSLDPIVDMPTFVWAFIIAPLLVCTTGAWLVVTVRVRRSRKP